MAEKAKSDSGYTAASGFYNSWSGFYDELSLAGCWLYKATGDKTYLEKAQKYAKQFGKEFQGGDEDAFSWTISWDDVHMGAEVLLAELTGEKNYYKAIENGIDCWNGKIKGSNPITITSGGLSYLSNWGSVRYANNQAFIDALYTTLPKADKQHIKDAEEYVKRTVNYTLGSWTNSLAAEPKDSRHTLVGAIVGGPASADDSSYKDDRADYQANEVACDYNSGFTGAVAYLYEKGGYGNVNTASAIEKTDGKEFVVNAGINCQDAHNKVNFVEIKAVVENHTAWPARVTDNFKLRLYFDISDVIAHGQKPEDFKISTTYQQYKSIKVSDMKKTSSKGMRRHE